MAKIAFGKPHSDTSWLRTRERSVVGINGFECHQTYQY